MMKYAVAFCIIMSVVIAVAAIIKSGAGNSIQTWWKARKTSKNAGGMPKPPRDPKRWQAWAIVVGIAVFIAGTLMSCVFQPAFVMLKVSQMGTSEPGIRFENADTNGVVVITVPTNDWSIPVYYSMNYRTIEHTLMPTNLNVAYLKRYQHSGSAIATFLVQRTGTNVIVTDRKTGKAGKKPTDWTSIQFQMESPKYPLPMMIQFKSEK